MFIMTYSGPFLRVT